MVHEVGVRQARPAASGGSPTTPRIAVVVPVFDAEATLATQLEALARQTYEAPWELILADNGSTDRSTEIAQEYAHRLPLLVVPAGEVRGAAHARNVGARASRAARLAFVDADDEVAPGWLAAIDTALERHDAVASRFEKERLNPPDLAATRTLAQEQGLGKHNYAAFLPHAGGSGLAVHRDHHEAIGGFDEQLLRLEDTDYSWRLQLAGHTLHFAPDAVVHVRFRASGRASVRQAFEYGRYNGLLYQRYRARGMAPASLLHDARRILVQLTKLPFERTSNQRTKRLRAIANRLGIVVGRLRHREARP